MARSILATLALFNLLPLLALFTPVSATHDGKRSVDKRQSTTTFKALSFQNVGDMGISAQMVSSSHFSRIIYLYHLFCGIILPHASLPIPMNHTLLSRLKHLSGLC